MKHWELYFIKFIHFNSIAAGYTTLNIDFKKRCLIHSQTNKIIATIQNILFLIWLPLAFVINISNLVLIGHNPVLRYVYNITIIARLIFLLLTNISRPKRDAMLKLWLEKVLMLQTSYFDRFPNEPRDTRLRYCLYFNAALMIVHTTTMFTNLWVFILSHNWWNFFNAYTVVGTITIQHLIMLHHGSLLCFLYECFGILNYQLRHEILDHKLVMIYYHLTTLLQQLNTIFNSTSLWIHLGLLLTNSLVGYIIVFVIFTGHLDFNLFTSLLGTGLYVLLCLHLYIYFTVCELILQVTRNTSFILRKYTEKSYNQEVSFNKKFLFSIYKILFL